MAIDVLPGRQEASKRALVGRLYLLAQYGQRGPAQPSQHLRVAPLPLGAAGTELAPDKLVGALQPVERGTRIDAVARLTLVRGERAVSRRVAPYEMHQRVRHVL